MDMPISSGSHSKIEIITGVQRRRRWTPEQKLAWVRRTTEPGMSVSLVAASGHLYDKSSFRRTLPRSFRSNTNKSFAKNLDRCKQPLVPTPISYTHQGISTHMLPSVWQGYCCQDSRTHLPSPMVPAHIRRANLPNLFWVSQK